MTNCTLYNGDIMEEWVKKIKEINKEYTRRYKYAENDILYSLCGCLYNWRSLNSSFQEGFETYMDQPMIVWRCKHGDSENLCYGSTLFRIYKFWTQIDANFTYRYYLYSLKKYKNELMRKKLLFPKPTK